MTVRELRERAAQEAKAAREIKEKVDAEGRGMTEEEAKDHDKHVKEARRIIKEAERQDELEAVEAKLNQPVERKVTPEIATGERIEVEPNGPRLYRHGELRAFKGPKAQINAYRSGRFLAAVVFNDASSRQWCREHGIEIRKDMDIDSRAMGEAVNTKGGFLVPDEFEASVIDLREQYGNARRNLRVKPMASDHANEPKKVTGVTAYPVGEAASITESDQAWGNVELTARKWAVLTRISTELSEDTLISLADDLAQDIALAFATAEDNACIDGDGTSTYHGIIGIRTKMIDGSHTGSYYDGSSGCDNWSEITDAHLLIVMAALPMYARRRAKWHCSPTAKVAVFDRLMRAAGGVTMAEVAAGAQPRYMGYPIEEWPSMPTDDASAALNDKIMFFFGDLMMSSKMGTRRGITIKTLVEKYADTDQIGIVATERFDINHHSITGATSSARGPVVGFMGGT
jgi:HK97 family phage major capsid protein